MADLQRAREGFYAFARYAASPRAVALRHHEPTDEALHRHLGRGPCPATRRSHPSLDSRVALRALAVSGAVAAVVLGGFFLLHGLGRGEDEGEAPQSNTAVADVAPAVAATTPGAPAQDAGHIAALLSAEPAPAVPPPASAGPTPDDFSRPAFLEPRDPDKADADAAVDRQPHANPSDAVPVPAARPATTRSATNRAEETGAAGHEGRITLDINMRSAPRDGSTVLTTLAAGTKVKVYSCKAWCDVSAHGKRGYVYKRAVEH